MKVRRSQSFFLGDSRLQHPSISRKRLRALESIDVCSMEIKLDKKEAVPGGFSNIHFIVNPRAGKRGRELDVMIRETLGESGVAFEVRYTTHRRHALELARAAADEDVGLVVAAGGDGTVNEVANGLVGSQTALGILPVGSGNGFARSLGVPMDPVRACRGLLDARVRSIDAGRIAGRCFFSTAGVGLDAEVSWLYDRKPGRRRGFLPYVVLTAQAFRSFEPEEVTVTLDDGTTIRTCPTVLTVANTAQYGSRAVIAPGALPDDGLLDLCVVEDTGALKAMWHSRRLFTGTIDRMPGVRLFRCRSLQIVRAGPGRFQADGEALEGEAVLDVEVVPQAIRVALSEDRSLHGISG